MARIVSKEESELLLRADGRWFHQGEVASHAGISRFFHKQIRKDEAGAFYLHNRMVVPETGLTLEEHVYFELEDTAYFVEAVRLDAAAPALVVRLNTDAEVAADPGGVVQDEAGQLYLRLPSGDEARFGRHAAQQLEPVLELRDEQIVIVLGRRTFPIGTRR